MALAGPSNAPVLAERGVELVAVALVEVEGSGHDHDRVGSCF